MSHFLRRLREAPCAPLPFVRGTTAENPTQRGQGQLPATSSPCPTWGRGPGEGTATSLQPSHPQETPRHPVVLGCCTGTRPKIKAGEGARGWAAPGLLRRLLEARKGGRCPGKAQLLLHLVPAAEARQRLEPPYSHREDKRRQGGHGFGDTARDGRGTGC